MSSTRTRPDTTGVRTAPVSQRPTNALVVGLVLVAAFAVLVVLALTGTGGESDDPAGSAAVPSGMAHVHGLGVDPGDGTLYAGTHYGLFRVPEQGEAERVGEHVQDFMGFTVVGPGHYLASGHPGADQDAPGNLGLIETTDGGQTWETLSLSGEADFHALEVRHGKVYGWNAGQFMVSDDKQNWAERAQILLADFAVSPADADTVVATTQQGVGISTDGGRTFSALRAAPLLQLVSWTDGGTLVGVDPQGGVFVSDDVGQTWQERGSAGGQPHALTANDEVVYVALAGEIVASQDGGETFETRYREA